MSQAKMKWDASDYAQNATAQYVWAQSLIERLALKGDEAILDLGCGDGRITAEIAAQHAGRVVGSDSSSEMVCLATEKYAGQPDLAFLVMDAAALKFDTEFELIFSNAALHWVKDHRAVLAGMNRALRAGGRVVLSMGGKGNALGPLSAMDSLVKSEKWRPWFEGFVFPYAFYGIEEYATWLAEAGFTPSRLELVPKDMVHESVDGLKGWIRTTWFPYTQRVPQTMQETFIDELVASYLENHPADDFGRTHVKMVRLEVEASK
jgi:trans-aconitate 2-methyltransferase